MGCRTEDDDANVIFRTGPRVTHVVLECALVLASTLLETPEQENISLVTCCRKMKVKRSYRCHDGIFFSNSDLRLHGATGEPSDKKQEVETHFTGEAA